MMKTVKFFAGLLICISVMVLSSCAEGCDDSERFSSDVQNAQLSSPEIDKSCFTTVTSASGAELVKFTWPLVKGAGGYYCRVSSLDNPEEPEVLVDTLIDGLTVLFDKAEDTNYLCEVTTLGNEKLNNAGADAPSVFTYSTLVEAIKIPEGNDISEFIGKYITENKEELDQKYQEDPNNYKLAFELEGGKTYTMNDSIDFLGYPAVLRGDKQAHAIVEMGEKAFFSCWRSMKIQWLTLNAAKITNGVLTMPATPEPSILSSTGQYIVKSVIFQECEINDLTKYIAYDNKQKYCIEDLEYIGCNIKVDHQNTLFYFSLGSYIKFGLTNCTLWSTTQTNKMFVNFGGNAGKKIKNLDDVLYNTSLFKFNNCTVYNIGYSVKWASWGQYSGKPDVTMDIQNVIFVNCGLKKILESTTANGNNTLIYSNNTYWYDGEEVIEDERFTKGVPTLKTDPGFADPDNGDFTISGADQLKFKTGDPRWIK